MKKIFLPFILLLTIFLHDSFAQSKNAGAPTAPKPAIAVSYGIVVDNSGSYRSLLDKVIEITKDVVEENKADDETFLVRFVSSDKIKLLQDFTPSKDAIHEAADEMFVEGGQTAILDAVEFAAKYLAENANATTPRRKVLVLISDGDDRQNAAKIENVVKFLKDNQIQVFALGLSDEKVSSKVLGKLTKETGGKNFVPRTPSEIAAVVKELAAAIRAQ